MAYCTGFVLPFCLLWTFCSWIVFSKVEENVITVAMEAKFQSFPLFYEISEYLNDKKIYFEFMEEYMTKYKRVGVEHDDVALYRWLMLEFLAKKQSRLGQSQYSLLPLLISLHTYAPRLALFNNVFQQHNFAHNATTVEVYKQKQGKKLPEKCKTWSVLNAQDVDTVLKEISSTIESRDAELHTSNAYNEDDGNELPSSSLILLNDIDHAFGCCQGAFTSSQSLEGAKECVNDDNKIFLVLYADYANLKVLAPLFITLLSQVKHEAKYQNACLIVRPVYFDVHQKSKPLTLQVCMKKEWRAIKNMEYKVLDDRNMGSVQTVEVESDGKVHSEHASPVSSTQTLLIEQLQQSINALTLDGRDEKTPNLKEMQEENMKEYMSKIGIQTTYLLLQWHKELTQAFENKTIDLMTRNQQFLDMFTELSTNFPHYTHLIPHISEDHYDSIQGYLNTLKQYWREGTEMLRFNGLPLPVSDLDIFDFFQKMDSEAYYIDLFKQLLTSSGSTTPPIATHIKNLLNTPIDIGFGSDNGDPLRIDMRVETYLLENKGVEKEYENLIVTWTNDIEKDNKYKTWPNGLEGLQSFMVFRQIVPIRRNMYNVICIIDSFDYLSLGVFYYWYSMFKYDLPIQEDDKKPSIELLTKAFVITAKDLKSSKKACELLEALFRIMHEDLEGTQESLIEAAAADPQQEMFGMRQPTLQQVERAIQNTHRPRDTEHIFKAVPQYSDHHRYLEIVHDFVEHKGLTALLHDTQSDGNDIKTEASGLTFIFNGQLHTHVKNLDQMTIMNMIMAEQRMYMIAFSQGKISKKTNFNSFVYQQNNVLARYSFFLSWLTRTSVSLPSSNPQHSDIIVPHLPKIIASSQSWLQSIPYLTTHSIFSNTEKSNTPLVTVWVLLNFGNGNGKDLFVALSKLNQMATTRSDKSLQHAGVRLALLDNTLDCYTADALAPMQGKQFDWETFQNTAQKWRNATLEQRSCNEKGKTENQKIASEVVKNLGLQSGHNYIVIDGLVVPIDDAIGTGNANAEASTHSASIVVQDIWTLLQEFFKATKDVYPQMKDLPHDVVLQIVNALIYRATSGYVVRETLFEANGLSIHLSNSDANENEVVYDIVSVLNPLSPHTQKLVSLFKELYLYKPLHATAPKFNIQILFAPDLNMKDEINKYGFPSKLNRYYRLAFHANSLSQHLASIGQSSSDHWGHPLNIQDNFVFQNVPKDQVELFISFICNFLIYICVLTMGIVNTPGTWLFEALGGVHDLDNLLLSKVPSSKVTARYQLLHILLQGQCFDEHSSPVAGLQLELNPGHTDTIVMQNLGYFQLKSNPGIWNLHLKEGRSRQVYQINTQAINDPRAAFDEQTQRLYVTMSTFTSTPFRLYVKKQVGMENEDLLPPLEKKDEPDQKGKDGKLVNIFKSWFGDQADNTDSAIAGSTNGKTNRRKDAKAPEDTTVHIMSVASGHLYERFLKVGCLFFFYS
ncbi:UDP-glucose ceramide glucosyltransferase-like protein [Reticulomyxa filosa]|uniref:UDP-glucose ceramide glucosyltransferase-like protein n=1 Tax=Reticulomyxa filosa TaxID=46433 RepID=X6NNI9_RETFI|nr:UDP-glucose ceramide glucosyltransferase-like protein [Reticulomyxa filosa]|eukprot:ETO27493.1 UDP-glucose ceramide glucosyltransferase-like protein [Reticulomyxa filosa]